MRAFVSVGAVKISAFCMPESPLTSPFSDCSNPWTGQYHGLVKSMDWSHPWTGQNRGQDTMQPRNAAAVADILWRVFRLTRALSSLPPSLPPSIPPSLPSSIHPYLPPSVPPSLPEGIHNIFRPLCACDSQSPVRARACGRTLLCACAHDCACLRARVFCHAQRIRPVLTHARTHTHTRTNTHARAHTHTRRYERDAFDTGRRNHVRSAHGGHGVAAAAGWATWVTARGGP
jgi:hypothetical protein